ncbi:immunity 53 family protein [Xanthomonas sp. D-109]|uniref:immunity 53 family protein n=1 Tax=Xanthomonas sp. D-109 TaxID=2821274 RepID=UPI001ADAA4D2|nr:immunity 53 family protein [Xanthomonas sp. D-109]MBO9881104.1 immunity 53 family protein [Xanthomonas sp. D-109]
MNEQFEKLQKWYLSQCDEDWEHTYGVEIKTLDNPGWILRIDISDTELEGIIMQRSIIERSEIDWIQYEVTGDKFVSCGGALNLAEMVDVFLRIAEADKS